MNSTRAVAQRLTETPAVPNVVTVALSKTHRLHLAEDNTLLLDAHVLCKVDNTVAELLSDIALMQVMQGGAR